MKRRDSIIAGISAITAGSALTTTATAAETKSDKADKPELEKIKAVLKAHDEAMTSHNLKGVLAVLAPKAVIMGTGPGEVWTGEEEITDAYKHFFADYDKGAQDFTYHVRYGELADEMGWMLISGEVKGKKEGKAFAFPMNISLTVSKAGGDWKIAALHFSTLTSEKAGK